MLSFNVYINDELVLERYDIYAAAGGKNIAIREEYTTYADEDGNVSILFENRPDSPLWDFGKCNGIEIRGLRP